MASTGDLITRIYNNFRGADFRGDEINLVRSPDCLNVWKDYKETESIRTRPKMKLVQNFDEKVRNVWHFKAKDSQGNDRDMVLVHSGNKLHKIENGETTEIFDKMAASESGGMFIKANGFVFNNKFYFTNGFTQFYEYDGTNAVKQVVGYIPTTSIGRRPSATAEEPNGGTIHEDVNLLSTRRINTFVGDGENTYFFLDTTDLNTNESVIVKVNGVVWGGTQDTLYSVYKGDGKGSYVSFLNAPPAPSTDGQDNVSIEFAVTMGNASKVTTNTVFQVFDNRVFAGGSRFAPSQMRHCSLNDPTYWSDLDYYDEGADGAAIKGMVAGNNALWVFREPSSDNATIFYHVPTIDAEYGKIYPSAHSSIATGCVGKAINFNDDIVFFSDRGMEGISGDVTTEQVIAHRSTLVDSKLLSENGYKDMILAEWEGYLVVIIGNKAYLADSRAKFTNTDHYEYEWFYWEFDKEIRCANTIDGVLYLGTDDGIYTLTDNEGAVESYWTTPKDKFNAPNKLKTTNKRGCVVEAKGDLVVSVKVEDTDYEHIGTFLDILDYFVCRIKRKKWKDIQIKFYSPTRFSLETATLESFVGGYIKR